MKGDNKLRAEREKKISAKKGKKKNFLEQCRAAAVLWLLQKVPLWHDQPGAASCWNCT